MGARLPLEVIKQIINTHTFNSFLYTYKTFLRVYSSKYEKAIGFVIFSVFMLNYKYLDLYKIIMTPVKFAKYLLSPR